CAGRSGSVTVAVKVSVEFSIAFLSVITARAGGRLISPVVTAIVSEWLCGGEPLSVARTVMNTVAGACASVGVHVKTPETGLIVAPDGAFSSENVSDCVGISESVAEAVKVSNAPSFTDLAPIGLRTGGAFNSVTVTVMVLKSLFAG